MADIAKAAQESSDLALWQAYCEKKMALEDAADEIERLRAECQRLAGEVSRAHRDALAWMERAAAARAEAERLRAALRRALNLHDIEQAERPAPNAPAWVEDARAALAATEPGHE